MSFHVTVIGKVFNFLLNVISSELWWNFYM